jgi:hypothetical protein
MRWPFATEEREGRNTEDRVGDDKMSVPLVSPTMNIPWNAMFGPTDVPTCCRQPDLEGSKTVMFE